MFCSTKCSSPNNNVRCQYYYRKVKKSIKNIFFELVYMLSWVILKQDKTSMTKSPSSIFSIAFLSSALSPSLSSAFFPALWPPRPHVIQWVSRFLLAKALGRFPSRREALGYPPKIRRKLLCWRRRFCGKESPLPSPEVDVKVRKDLECWIWRDGVNTISLTGVTEIRREIRFQARHTRPSRAFAASFDGVDCRLPDFP